MKIKTPLFLFLFLFVTCLAQARTSHPEFSFTDLAGKNYTNQTLKGTPVVVSVGSTL